MTAATVPVQMCDDEDGCTEWMVDYYALCADNWRALLGGWRFDPYVSDQAFCPEHATVVVP